MKKSWDKLVDGYHQFRQKYADGDNSVMERLAFHGQKPETMIIACSDSRVDPALIMQCDPGELFVVRNVANIVPPYENDNGHHGVSAALEFGICFLGVKHLILLGHSQCGGIQAVLDKKSVAQTDFITDWVSLVDSDQAKDMTPDDYAKIALSKSAENCLTFPWIKDRIDNGALQIHLWFFDIKTGKIHSCNERNNIFSPLE